MKRKQPVSPRIETLQEELRTGKSDALEVFWSEVAEAGAPLIEVIEGEPQQCLVTFLWRDQGDTDNVVVVGRAMANWRDWQKHQLTHLPESDLWYKTYCFRSDLRLPYWLSHNDSLLDIEEGTDWKERYAQFQLDPLNRHQHTYPKDEEIPDDEDWSFSVLELPDAPAQPWITPRSDVPHGKVELFHLRSDILNNERRVHIYTPPGYSPKHEAYGLLMIFDGPAYVSSGLVPTPTILDNLIAERKIPPLVAVLPDSLDQKTRSLELPCYEPFVDFLKQELLPWVHTHYHVTNDPQHMIVAGSSYGGLAATFVAFKAPEIFGNVLSQSGAFRWNPLEREKEVHDNNDEAWLIRQFVASPVLPLRLFLEVGLWERNATDDMVLMNRRMRDVLEAKGYEVTYSEFNGGHDYISWRGSLADGLIWLTEAQSR
jgi:enterochelin esterase family protein